jgi:hypothetical protein
MLPHITHAACCLSSFASYQTKQAGLDMGHSQAVPDPASAHGQDYDMDTAILRNRVVT